MVINKDKIKENIRLIYMCFMVVYMITREVVPFYFLIDSAVLSIAIFAVGFLIIFWDILTDKNCIKGRAIDWFFIFAVVCVISSIVNIKYGIAANIRCIAGMVLQFGVFFSSGSGRDKQQIKREINYILNTLIVITFFLMLVSVTMYLFHIDYSVVYLDRPSLDQGFDTLWGRLWGVFQEPNFAGCVSLTAIFSCAYFIIQYKKVWAYVFYGLNIILQLSFVALTGSRMDLVLLILVPIVSSIYPLLAFIKTNKKKAVYGFLSMLIISGILFGGYIGIKKGIPYGKSAFLNAIGMEKREKVVTLYDKFYESCGIEVLNVKDNHVDLNSENSEEDFADKTEIEKIERKDKKDDYSNGRFARWMGGIEVFKTTPIIGTSPRNAVAMAKERTPDTVMGKYGWIAHCSYLDIFVNTGILGSIFMYGALIYIVIAVIKGIIKNGFSYLSFITFVICVIIAGSIFFISDVFFAFSINSLLFYCALGYLYHINRADKNGFLFKTIEKFTKILRRN